MATDTHPSERTLRKVERLLRAAHELVADRAMATVGAFARDHHGNRLPLERVNDARAVRWSLLGALLYAAYIDSERRDGLATATLVAETQRKELRGARKEVGER